MSEMKLSSRYSPSMLDKLGGTSPSSLFVDRSAYSKIELTPSRKSSGIFPDKELALRSSRRNRSRLDKEGRGPVKPGLLSLIW